MGRHGGLARTPGIRWMVRTRNQNTKGLKKWHQAAKNRKKLSKAGAATDANNANFASGESTPNRQGSSPLHLLQYLNVPLPCSGKKFSYFCHINLILSFRILKLPAAMPMQDTRIAEAKNRNVDPDRFWLFICYPQ